MFCDHCILRSLSAQSKGTLDLHVQANVRSDMKNCRNLFAKLSFNTGKQTKSKPNVSFHKFGDIHSLSRKFGMLPSKLCALMLVRGE